MVFLEAPYACVSSPEDEQEKQQEIIKTIREAARTPIERQNRALTFSPYHKPLENAVYQLLLRREDVCFPGPEFSLDVGVLDEDQGKFLSKAWFDFSVALYQGQKYKSFGHAYKLHEVPSIGPAVARPVAHHLNHALYVSPDIRRHHVAESLITASRIILADLSVSPLILTGVSNPEEGFYHKINAHIFATEQEARVGKAILPTSQTARVPYRFL